MSNHEALSRLLKYIGSEARRDDRHKHDAPALPPKFKRMYARNASFRDRGEVLANEMDLALTPFCVKMPVHEYAKA